MRDNSLLQYCCDIDNVIDEKIEIIRPTTVVVNACETPLAIAEDSKPCPTAARP